MQQTAFSEKEQLTKNGFLKPSKLLGPDETRDLLERLREAQAKIKGNPWSKASAALSRTFFEIATDKRIIDKLVALIGTDILLWGADLLVKRPGQAHPWHSDIESWNSGGKLVNVWIALENVSRNSGLRAISGSQKFDETVQQLRADASIERAVLCDEEIVSWARVRNPESQLVNLDMTEGDVVFFDGKLWHDSQNLTDSDRVALLLQYATTDSIIKLPDLSQVDWPFRYREERPPCLLVSGVDAFGRNRMVQAPNELSTWCRGLTSRAIPLQLPLSCKLTDADWMSSTSEDRNELGWTPHPVLSGSTSILDRLKVHTSVLRRDCCPHQPHKHEEEELVIVLDGEVEIHLPEVEKHAQTQRLGKGDFVYYPIDFAHTLTAKSQPTATYLMLKWKQKKRRDRGKSILLPFSLFNYLNQTANSKVSAEHSGFSFKRFFEGPTHHLKKLHCHYSTLTPGAGYEPHIDPYDVVLVILEGQVETLGQVHEPYSVIFYAAGEPHGLRNCGTMNAKYLVFEFHGERQEAPPQARSLASKLADPQCWKRLILNILKVRD